MKYKVGDKVRIKSLDWYNENKDKRGFICFVYANFIPEMSRYCGEILTINQVVKEHEQYRMSECGFAWTDEMIEECVESIEDRLKELRKMCTISLTNSNYTNKVEVLLNDYEYIEENGKAYFVKKKKEYPKTYEECCVLLGAVKDRHYFLTKKDKEDYPNEVSILNILDDLRRVLICRDAYWKIAGKEMGLGKSWKPDWREERYIIYRYQDDIIGDYRVPRHVVRHIFEFPTEEMRDAFYENFKEEIEMCKELL